MNTTAPRYHHDDLMNLLPTWTQQKRRKCASIILTTLLLHLATCSSTSSEEDLTCSADLGYHRVDNQPLRPSDLPPIRMYQDWANSTTTVHPKHNEKKSTTLSLSSGVIRQAGDGDYVSHFDMLHSVVTTEEHASMLQLLNADWLQTTLDQDPDSVDGYATQEFFLDNENLRSGESGKPGYEFPQHFAARKALRAELLRITQPILEERINPYVNQRFPTCQGVCTPCHSLIRRYVYGERQAHFPHRDGHAHVTVVVSLSNHGDEYLGGLYVASETGKPHYLGLNRGDAAVHQSDLLHGVKAHPLTNKDGSRHSLRWSWILWYKVSDECVDNSWEWAKDCAEAGNPTCAMMHANAVGRTPGISRQDEVVQATQWNLRAADKGQPTACVKIARQLLGKFASLLKPSRQKAAVYYKKAIASANDPDAHYGLATMYLENAVAQHKAGKSSAKLVEKAVRHLEASAVGGNPYAMFNLGLASLFGYGGPQDPALAGEWFEASGIPEGYAARALHFDSVGQPELAKEFQRRALSLGFNTPWRKAALERTGYGGCAGADFNQPWPPNAMGVTPPEW